MAVGKSLLGRLIAIPVGLAVALGVGWFWYKGEEKVHQANAPGVGTCLTVSGGSFDADHEELPCDDPAATYEVVDSEGTCDASAEINYTITLGAGNDGNVADLCLALNAAEGDCFDQGSIARPAEKVDCAKRAGPVELAVWAR
jgi:hypothetical protein